MYWIQDRHCREDPPPPHVFQIWFPYFLIKTSWGVRCFIVCVCVFFAISSFIFHFSPHLPTTDSNYNNASVGCGSLMSSTSNFATKLKKKNPTIRNVCLRSVHAVWIMWNVFFKIWESLFYLLLIYFFMEIRRKCLLFTSDNVEWGSNSIQPWPSWLIWYNVPGVGNCFFFFCSNLFYSSNLLAC